MGFEVWIVIVLVASGLSGWIGFAYARKDAPKQADLDAMAAELDEARQQAESVQANVSEHFEQSAMLFGKLAADYREFLDHFESSAQNLGLSEARARDLIEQGFQPLLTQQEVEDSVVAEAGVEAEAQAEAQTETQAEAETEAQTQAEAETAEVDSVAEPAPAEQTSTSEDATRSTAEVGEVTVELPDDATVSSEETAPKSESSDKDDPLTTERQRA